MAAKKKMSFEEALKGLEQAAELLKKEDTALEDAIHCYEEGTKYFRYCNEILTTAKQKIQIYDASDDTLKEFAQEEER